MRFLNYILPHISLCMSVAGILLVILDGFNPMMAFLTSSASKILLIIAFIIQIIISFKEISFDKK